MLTNLVYLVGCLTVVTAVGFVLAVWYARFYERWEDRVRAEAEQEAVARRHVATLAEIEDIRRATAAALVSVAPKESLGVIEGAAVEVKRR